MKTYIAGAMSNIPNLNHPKFNKTAKWLRRLGYVVINPAELDAGKSLLWTDCLKRDLKKLVTCGGIYLLRGWEHSRGACLEAIVAKCLGLRFYFEGGQATPYARRGNFSFQRIAFHLVRNFTR